MAVRQRMFPPLVPSQRSGRFWPLATPAAARPRKRRPAARMVGRWRQRANALRAGAHDPPRRYRIASAGGPPRTAIHDHATWLAVIGDQIEVHAPSFDPDAVVPGALTPAHRGRREADLVVRRGPGPLERWPAFARERERAVFREARGEESECQRRRWQRLALPRPCRGDDEHRCRQQDEEPGGHPAGIVLRLFELRLFDERKYNCRQDRATVQ